MFATVPGARVWLNGATVMLIGTQLEKALDDIVASGKLRFVVLSAVMIVTTSAIVSHDHARVASCPVAELSVNSVPVFSSWYAILLYFFPKAGAGAGTCGLPTK